MQRCKIKRYDINNIQNLDLVPVKNYLLSNVEKLYYVFKNNEWKNKTVKNLNKRINSFNSTNHVQKFIADCYNHVSNESVSVKHKRIKKNNKQFIFYIF